MIFFHIFWFLLIFFFTFRQESWIWYLLSAGVHLDHETSYEFVYQQGVHSFRNRRCREVKKVSLSPIWPVLLNFLRYQSFSDSISNFRFMTLFQIFLRFSGLWFLRFFIRFFSDFFQMIFWFLVFFWFLLYSFLNRSEI